MNQVRWDEIRESVRHFGDKVNTLQDAMNDLYNYSCNLDVQNQVLTKENQAFAKQGRWAVSLYSALGEVLSQAKEDPTDPYFQDLITQGEKLLKDFSDGATLPSDEGLHSRLDSAYERIRYATRMPTLQRDNSVVCPVELLDIKLLVETAKKYQALMGVKP